jgi:hypothetical protein
MTATKVFLGTVLLGLPIAVGLMVCDGASGADLILPLCVVAIETACGVAVTKHMEQLQ